MRIAILAYGSLIKNPGKSIKDLEEERRTGVRTPFRVEFARKSSTRCEAPTLVPVEDGGAYVEATLIGLREGTSLEQARDILYQRECHKEGTKERYKPDPDNEKQVWVEVLPEWAGLDYVLYTRIRANIKTLEPEHLAELAIKSAEENAGQKREDGITYLKEH